jgi:multidrug resistance efflux pump
MGGGAMTVLGLIALAVLLLVRGVSGAHRPDLVLHRVKYENLPLNITERGALESGKNSDIYCRVKAGSKGSTIASQIKMVIDDGSQVLHDRPLKEVKTILTWDAAAGTYRARPGEGGPDGLSVVELEDEKTGRKNYADLLVDLDDSGLLEQVKAQKIVVDKAESDKIQAEEAYNITASQNDSDIKTAETKVELTTIDLMKYTGLNRDEVLKPATLARLKEELKEAAANSRRASKELAEADLKKYQSGDYLAALKDSLGQIENAQTDLSQQEDREAWAYRMMKKGYQTASQAQAETSRRESFQLTLNKVSLQLDVLVKYTKISQLTAFITALEEAQRALERVRGQAKSKEVQARIDRAAKKSIWEQETAHYKDFVEEIKKCKIYAPQDGMVVYYVPEQARWGGGSQQSIVAQGEPVREGQKLMQIPDLRYMLVNTKVHEALVSRVHPGQPALVKVESYGDRVLHGKVESVATVAAQQDFMAADVKVYTTKVAIDPEDIKGLSLKPGMSAAVTISISDAREHVLAVPVQAVIGGAELGAERKVLVMTPDGPTERPITVGASNLTMAEIREGLQEGDEVVLNPKAVLGDKIQVGEPGADKGLQVPSPEKKADAPGSSSDGGTKDGKNKGTQVEKPKASNGPSGDWQNMTPEERQKRFQQMQERWRKATPEERKRMLEQIPEDRRERVKAGLKAAGIDVPD